MTSGSWSFDDDRGNQVVVANRPTRVLAYTQAAQTLARLGVPVVGYFGSQHHADTGAQPALAGLDVPCVGSGDAVEVYGVTETVAAKLADIAPILLVNSAGDPSLESVIGRFHQLAQALTTSDTPDAETDLTSAIAQLTIALNEQPAVRVMALSGGTPTDAYVPIPPTGPASASWPRQASPSRRPLRKVAGKSCTGPTSPPPIPPTSCSTTNAPTR
jgi:iron complex transport system substrate-binding protein